VSGDLDAELTAGHVNVNLHLKALDVIDKPVKMLSPFTLSPGVAAGKQALTIGPLTLPEGLPGDVTLDGTVQITNAKNEPVACVKVALNVPALSSPPPEATPAEKAPQAVGICSQASDHLKSLAISTSPQNVTTVTGTLDELVSKLTVDLDLTLKVLIFSHKVTMAIPVSYTPGLPKGDLKLTAGPPQTPPSLQSRVGPVSVSGTVKMNDAQSQEIACLSVSSPEPSIDLVTV